MVEFKDLCPSNALMVRRSVPFSKRCNPKACLKKVAGKPMFHPKGGFHGENELVDGKRSHGLIGMSCIGEKIALRLSWMLNGVGKLVVHTVY